MVRRGLRKVLIYSFILHAWSRVADRLSLCQVLAGGALSARDGERLGSGLPDGVERRGERGG